VAPVPTEGADVHLSAAFGRPFLALAGPLALAAPPDTPDAVSRPVKTLDSVQVYGVVNLVSKKPLADTTLRRASLVTGSW